ncbi:hypothetical protein QFC20_000399 [Naganishia adeliensis]|uniref:Uncharacterized protein n=1 Tax=Naganishia adeliensis TaxID=92952 RepID=A0ACC2X1L6_9TREE|nr:hypothetical protein QFC20_000399 [Naganishia adeliensis]
MSISREPSMAPPPRPRTSGSFLSRPPSTRPGTALGARSIAPTDDLGEWVVAVNQARAFPKTIHHLSLHPPGIILVPDTSLPSDSLNVHANAGRSRKAQWRVSENQNASILVQCLESKFEVPCEGVSREFWSDIQGYQNLKNYIAEDDGKKAGVVVNMQDKYYGSAALGALFSYLSQQGESFAAHSLRIEYQALEGTMLIDFDTANNLELVRSSLDSSSKNSLYGKPKPAFMTHMAFVLDDRYVSIRGDEQDTHEDGWKALAVYYTSAGHRQVFVARRVPRRSFCAHAVKEILENRLDVVEELLENDALRKALKTTLIGIDNFSRPLKGEDAAAVERRIDDLLSLRRLITSIDMFATALQGAQSGLLQTALSMLNDPRAQDIDDLLKKTFNEDTTVHQGKRRNYKAIRLCAIIAEPNGTLDIARKTHTEHVEDIHKLKEAINEEYDVNLEVKYEGDRFTFWGFVEEVDTLPATFSKGKKKGNKCYVNCGDLSKLNYRALESEQEVFKMCDQIVRDVSDVVVDNIACLYNATEAKYAKVLVTHVREVNVYTTSRASEHHGHVWFLDSAR